MEKMRQWLVLTAVGTLAVLVAGWFLLVSPQGKQASQLRQQADDQLSQNTTLQGQVNQLQAQRKGLPAQQKLLNQVAAKIPDNPALPQLIRELSTAATGAGVDLVSLAPSTPVTVAAAAPAAPAPSTGTGDTAGVPSHVAAPVAPLAQIPVTIQVSGSYFNIESFFSAIESLRRAMMVTQFTLSPAGSSTPGANTSSGGARATAPGTLTGQIQAVIFESPSVVAPATAPVTPAASAPASSASSNE